MDFIPDPSLAKSSSGFMPDPNQSAMALGHSNSLIEKMMGGAGAIAGGVANEALKFGQSAAHAPGDIANELQGKQPDTSTLPNFTGEGQQTFQGEFSSKTLPNVEQGKTSPLMGTLQTVGGVLSGAADFLGLGVAKKAVETVAPKVAESKVGTTVSDFLAKNADKKATQTAVKALTPKMTSSVIEEAGAGGKGVVPKIGAPRIDMTKDANFMKQVEATKGIVKGKSAIQDTNAVRDVLSTEAESLKAKVVASGSDRIYPFQELSAKISSAEEPISLRGTPFEKQIAPLKKAALQIARKNGGTISSLFDTRKEFDALVNKTYPNLWDKENAPMRNAVTAIRNTMNDFIESNLPEGTGFKESLAKQKTLYDSIDNIASKIPDEIKGGSTFAKRHPVVSGAAKYGAEAVGAGVVYEGAKKVGVPLP